MGFFSRPSMGDRMDNSQERQARRRMSPAEKELEKARGKWWNQQSAKERHAAQSARRYRGSDQQAEDVRRGFFGWR